MDGERERGTNMHKNIGDKIEYQHDVELFLYQFSCSPTLIGRAEAQIAQIGHGCLWQFSSDRRVREQIQIIVCKQEQ